MIDFSERLEIMMAQQGKGDNDSVANVNKYNKVRLLGFSDNNLAYPSYQVHFGYWKDATGLIQLPVNYTLTIFTSLCHTDHKKDSDRKKTKHESYNTVTTRYDC